MALEPGLDPLDEFRWELGGLLWDRIGEQGDDGLDDTAELEGDDAESAGDGETPGDQRLSPRTVSFQAWCDGDGTADEAMADLAGKLQALRLVMSPLPDRRASRLFRWRRIGEPAKRLWVRPSEGRALKIPGDRRRLLDGQAACDLRLVASDPVIVSDEFHTVSFSAGQTREIVNAGSFTAVQPIAWWITAPGPVALEHLDFPDEYIRFPTGPVTTTPRLAIDAPGAYGLCNGRSGSDFPQWPLLRHGVNRIKASAPCTFHWRDTW